MLLPAGSPTRLAPGQAPSSYLLAQGTDEPFQVLLLMQHHLLLLVLLFQLHLQLPELCMGDNPSHVQSPVSPHQSPMCQQGTPTTAAGTQVARQPPGRACALKPPIIAAGAGDQDRATSPGIPATLQAVQLLLARRSKG